MKKKILILFGIALILSSVCFKAKKNNLIDLTLVSIESFANPEGGDRWWYQPKTERCDFIQGGSHTSSVERICIVCVVPYSCTPVACGEFFIR